MTENWDAQHYKDCRQLMKQNLEHRPWPLNEKITCPFEWAKVFLPLISQAVHKENYVDA